MRWYESSKKGFGLGLAVVMAMAGCWSNESGHLSATVMGDMSNGQAPRERFDARLKEACGSAGFTEAGRAALLRKPYLQLVQSNSAALLWTAASSERQAVRVSLPDGTVVATVPAEVDTSAPLPRGTQYIAHLRDLLPGRIYCYEVLGLGGGGNETWQTRTGFMTAPPTGAEAPIRFVAMGDLGERTIDQFAVAKQLTTVVSDFMVITGDVAYDHGELVSFEDNIFSVYAGLFRHVPVFPASGNHDYETADAAAFRQVFALFENGGPEGIERWYSFDWGNVHVAVLDTEKYLAEQAVWLDRDLAASNAAWKIVVAHRPPYSSGWHGSDERIRAAFTPIFEKHSVDLVLLGHEHHYERTKPINGITYIVTGAGGRGTRAVGSSDFTALSARVSHFTYVVVDGLRLTAYVIDASGNQFDSLVLDKTLRAGPGSTSSPGPSSATASAAEPEAAGARDNAVR